jgi:hypothetical protein
MTVPSPRLLCTVWIAYPIPSSASLVICRESEDFLSCLHRGGKCRGDLLLSSNGRDLGEQDQRILGIRFRASQRIAPLEISDKPRG